MTAPYKDRYQQLADIEQRLVEIRDILALAFLPVETDGGCEHPEEHRRDLGRGEWICYAPTATGPCRFRQGATT